MGNSNGFPELSKGSVTWASIITLSYNMIQNDTRLTIAQSLAVC